MDVGTIVGIVLGMALICGSIALGDSFMAFINLPGVMIVVGGTIATAFLELSRKVSYFESGLCDGLRCTACHCTAHYHYKGRQFKYSTCKVINISDVSRPMSTVVN